MCPLAVRAALPDAAPAPARERTWSMLSNHGLVFVVIARDPHGRVRDIAERVGITERAAHRIVADLCAEGYISRSRVGRRTVYEVHADQRFRHPALNAQVIGPLLQIARDGAQSQALG
jgi:predicted ArsR family transcriptional regulator